jgi:hypothetical protein
MKSFVDVFFLEAFGVAFRAEELPDCLGVWLFVPLYSLFSII